MSTFPASALPPIDQALLPASVRTGNASAQQAYQTGLAFEQMLVQQLSQELTNAASGSNAGDGSDGSNDGSTDGTSGLMGSDPASSMYSQLLPTALSSGIMSAGGIGIAQQLASSLDPSLAAGASASPSAPGSAAAPTGGVAPSPPGGAA